VFYGIIKTEKTDFLLWILLLIFSICFLAIFNVGSNWSIRKGDFKKISYSKIVNSLSTNISRITFGFLNLGKWGLIYSFVLGLLLSSIHFLRDLFFINSQKNNQYSRKKMIVIAKIHKHFPLFNLPHALTDAVRDVIVAIILVEVFSSHLFGSFDFSYRMLRIPILLIGAAISQVLFNRIATLKNQQQVILPIFKKVLFTLVLLSIIPFSLIFLFGEPIFIFVFGQNWAQAGKLSEIMSPWLMVNFILSPFTVIPLILGKQKIFLIISLFGSITQILLFWLIPYYFINIESSIQNTFLTVTFSQVIFSVILIIFIYQIILMNDRSIKKL
jgi:O-antigen/teichoic acid export membrane protein